MPDAHEMLLYLFLAPVCARGCLSISQVDIAMRSTYLSVCVFISTVLSIPVAQSDDYLLNSDENSDATFSGLYRIVNCGANKPARLKPEALQVKAFLPKAWQQLRYLLADVKLGTASKYGYAALFKTNDSIATISESFQDIAKARQSLRSTTTLHWYVSMQTRPSHCFEDCMIKAVPVVQEPWLRSRNSLIWDYVPLSSKLGSEAWISRHQWIVRR